MTTLDKLATLAKHGKDGEKGAMPVDQFISELLLEIAEKRR